MDPVKAELKHVKQSLRLSREMAGLAELCSHEGATLGMMVEHIKPRDHALLTLLLALPFFLPIPLPGLSTVFGACIAVSGWRIFRGKHPYLPKKLMDRPVPKGLFIKLFQFGGKLMGWIEFLIKPRGKYFCTHPVSIAVNGAMIALCGVALALPLPPGTNFPPAVAIVLLSIGAVENDGLFIAAGYFVFALNVALFSLLPVVGYNGVMALWQKLV